MNDKTKAAAEAAEAKRKSELHEELKRKDAVELGLFAKEHGIDLTGSTTPEDMRAAIELHMEDQAKKAAADQAIKDMEADQAKKIAKESGSRDDTAKTMRALNTLFCSNVPQDARAGSFKPEKGDEVFGGDYDVPNGKYRVAGSEWVFEIKNDKLVGAVRASQRNDYGGKGVISV